MGCEGWPGTADLDLGPRRGRVSGHAQPRAMWIKWRRRRKEKWAEFSSIFFRCIFSHWDPKTCSVNNLTCAPLGGVESGTGAGREPLSESSPAVPIWSVSTLAAFVHPLSMSLSVYREPHYKTLAFSSPWGRWTSLNGEFCGRT